MKVDIRITIGDKIIADSFGEPDDIFRLRQFPSEMVSLVQHRMRIKMAEAVDKAIEELLTNGVVSKPTSYPPRPEGGTPYGLKNWDVT